MARALAAVRAGFRRTYSISSSRHLPTEKPPPPAEPTTNLFVSGLSKRTTSEGLREAFAKFGQVFSARVVLDRNSGYSKGYGFVKYGTLEDAVEGIKGMDGQYLDGWVIFAEYARPRPPQPPQQESSGYQQSSGGPGNYY